MSMYLQRISERISANVSESMDGLVCTLEAANPKFGADLAIPCFRLASERGISPPELAQQIASNLHDESIQKVEATGGYVNIWLDPKALAQVVVHEALQSSYGTTQDRLNQNILVEFSDQNPFKLLHIGHLYNNTVGEGISRLLETTGATVHRVSYHGDVGLHIAKALWGLKDLLNNDNTLDDIAVNEQMSFLGQAYAHGARAYKDDASVKTEIDNLNTRIYQMNDPEVMKLYNTGRDWSFAYFDSVYKRVGVQFEKQYFESQTGPKGLEIVRAHIGSVFEESDGAIIFRGEDHGLHTRVFINGKGLPTYEAKDLALAFMKDEDYSYDYSIVITAHEQAPYFGVMLKALEQINPDLAAKTQHVSHGEVKLPSGKMSSRTGDVITADALLDSVEDAIRARAPESPSNNDNMLAAIKYAFLKQNVGGDVVYDVEESISLEGQTGPYIQYAAVRISSILSKVSSTAEIGDYDWEAEKAVVMELAQYPRVVRDAVAQLAPHMVAQYVYGLAKELNRYYENTSVKDAPDDVRAARIQMLQACSAVFANALGILNIPVPEKM